jgi:hypothetical protein
MKSLVLAAAVLGLVAGTAQAGTESPATSGGSVCLWSYNIDHTKVVNPSTILFYMKNGKVWQSNLSVPCNGLQFHGFVMVGHEEEFCGGAQSISVLETHETCHLGKFAAYSAPAMTPVGQ